jgi:hypothetical protein
MEVKLGPEDCLRLDMYHTENNFIVYYITGHKIRELKRRNRKRE